MLWMSGEYKDLMDDCPLFTFSTEAKPFSVGGISLIENKV